MILWDGFLALECIICISAGFDLIFDGGMSHLVFSSTSKAVPTENCSLPFQGNFISSLWNTVFEGRIVSLYELAPSYEHSISILVK